MSDGSRGENTIRVVLTGASGFLGREICSYLSESQVDIFPVSRHVTKADGHIHQVDSYKETPLGDVLIHLAETADLSEANLKKDCHLNASVSRMASLLRKGYKKVIYFSSAVVYGDASTGANSPQQKVRPEFWYGKSKVACERIVLDSSPENIVVRLSNVYGGKMTNRNVISDILDQRDNTGPVYIRDGNPVRDFIWVNDVARCILKMINSSRGGIFNLGSGTSVSIEELTRTICTLWGTPDRKICSGEVQPTFSCLKLDINKTMQSFDWIPGVSLNRGLRKIIN